MGSCRYLIIYDRMLVTLYDIYETLKRARNVAAPANTQRLDVKTPCKTTGKCFDCKSPDTICGNFQITRYSRHTGRMHVILVNDVLGY